MEGSAEHMVKTIGEHLVSEFVPGRLHRHLHVDATEHECSNYLTHFCVSFHFVESTFVMRAEEGSVAESICDQRLFYTILHTTQLQRLIASCYICFLALFSFTCKQ